uniref:hypothetical protein n=1 Tax=Escherichia coli TaxID=562 RepID=UPI003FA599CE
MPGQPIPSELKEKGLIWLLPPYCWSHRQIARKLKISASVVSKWRCELVEQGLLPENEKITSVDVEDWTPERRFSVVLETATLSEMELADYCRRTGLFVEQVKEWRAISIQAHEKKLTENIRTDRALRDAKNKLRELEKELMNRPGFPGECFICELRLPDHRFRWKYNKLFLLLPEEYGPAFPAIVDCYTSPPT